MGQCVLCRASSPSHIAYGENVQGKAASPRSICEVESHNLSLNLIAHAHTIDTEHIFQRAMHTSRENLGFPFWSCRLTRQILPCSLDTDGKHAPFRSVAG